MTDEELANAVVALGDNILTRDGDTYISAWDFEEMKANVAIRDPLVAMALMKKLCDEGDTIGIEKQGLYEADVNQAYFRCNESPSRAIIEACVEALTND